LNLIWVNYIDVNIFAVNRYFDAAEKVNPEQNSSGVHLWLILMKSFQTLAAQAEESGFNKRIRLTMNCRQRMRAIKRLRLGTSSLWKMEWRCFLTMATLNPASSAIS
jgi:hypothetical protein